MFMLRMICQDNVKINKAESFFFFNSRCFSIFCFVDSKKITAVETRGSEEGGGEE